MKQDTFFTQSNCDRCGGDLKVRIMSWYNDETICGKCSEFETRLREMAKRAGLEWHYFEGCGHVPSLLELKSELGGDGYASSGGSAGMKSK